MFCDERFFCFLSLFFILNFIYWIFFFVLRDGSDSSFDWEVSSLLMSCFLMLDNVPVKVLSPPARLTFNTSVSTNPLSSYPCNLFALRLNFRKRYLYTTRNAISIQGMFSMSSTCCYFLNKISNSLTGSVIPYTHATMKILHQRNAFSPEEAVYF